MSRKLLFAALLLSGPGVAAMPGAAPVSIMPGYKLTAWTDEDGAPTNVTSLAQTADGYLWIGNSLGLFRFDGVGFERMSRFERVGGAGVASLLAARNGDLWIGYGLGGVGLLRAGRMVALPGQNGPKAWALSLAEAPDGAIWMVVGSSIFRFTDGHWARRKFDRWGKPLQVLVTSRGNVLLATRHAILQLDPRSLTPRVVAVHGDAPAGIAEDNAGTVWVVNATGMRRLNGTPSVQPLPSTVVEPWLSFDRKGNGWLVGNSRAILRQYATSTDGGYATRGVLFSAGNSSPVYTTPALEDREGNVWVGTEIGVERFRPINLAQHSLADPVLARAVPSGDKPYQVIADGRGTIYARIGRDLFRINDDLTAIAIRTPQVDLADSVCPAREGGLWIRSSRLTAEVVDGPRRRRVRLPAEAAAGGLHRCIEDGEHHFWAGIPRIGFFRFDSRDQSAERFDVDNHDRSTPFTLGLDASGHVLAYRGYSDLARDTGHGFERLVAQDRNPMTFVSAIAASPEGVLLGGETGLGRLAGRRLRTISVRDFPAFQDVSGVVQTGAGETWMISKAGILRMRTTDLDARFKDPRASLPIETLRVEDGLSGFSNVTGPPDVVEAANGRLWFATGNGIFSLDPTRLARNVVPPPIVIKSILADGRSMPVHTRLSLAAGTTSLEIAFTALSLSVPKRVQVRYRLIGQDDGWNDPGSRRLAIYTNLAPGRYRFEVVAANNDGVWNRAGVGLDFDIPPTFVQSRLFAGLFGALGLVAVWFLYGFELRRAAARIRFRHEERLRERERIARELHDTLLQGLQGLILRFQAIANRVGPTSEVRPSIDRALDDADHVLVQGRERVHQLRMVGGQLPLETRLERAAAELAEVHPIHHEILVDGSVRSLDAAVLDEAGAVAEEALRNAYRHGKASRVTVRINYGVDSFCVCVEDDGVGLSPKLASGGSRPSHYGLVGMRERAARVQGQLAFDSPSGGGTRVRLVIPRRIAYVDHRGRWRLLRKLFLLQDEPVE